MKGIALTPEEVGIFLQAAEDSCPEHYPLFLLAVRAGLRCGELVAIQWGDIEFGTHGHLIPGAVVSFVDRLDEKSTTNAHAAPQPSATPAQPSEMAEIQIPPELVDLIGGGEWN